MTDRRTLPIPAAHRAFAVKVDGTAVGREHHLTAVSVTKAVNRISSARLVYLDGSASASDFPLSNGSTFVPGARVEILAGAGGQQVSVFQGVVIRVGIKVRDNTAPQLVIDCRHEASKLTVGRKNAYFFDQTDSDVIDALLAQAGIAAEVEPSTTTHPQQVQYRATDWDFLLARAEANGKLVFTNDATVIVKAPRASGTAVCQLHFGATVVELDAEIDARRQFQAVTALTWDPGQQAVLETDAADPGVVGPGNLRGGDLAAVIALDRQRLLHAAMSEAEAQAWADAAWLKSRLSKVSGRVKCEGIATVNPGDLVTLSGVGDRFSGDVFVTAVRHDYDLVQGWKTHVQFGGVDGWAAEAATVSAADAGALLPAARGLQIGKVVSNEDPTGEHRVRVRLPLVDNAGDGVWARAAAEDAGDERGFFFRPEIGDEVVVGFLDADPRHPVILGMLHSSAKAPHLTASDANHEKGYQSRSKMRIHFDDEKKLLLLQTPAGNRVTLDESQRAVSVVDQQGNTIEMTEDGITISSPKAIELKAGTEIKLQSGTSFSAQGGTELKLEGTSSAELTSGAITKVRGSLVQIN